MSMDAIVWGRSHLDNYQSRMNVFAPHVASAWENVGFEELAAAESWCLWELLFIYVIKQLNR